MGSGAAKTTTTPLSAGARLAGKPIRVGVIGSGEMGTDLVTQMSLMSGIEMAAIATRQRGRRLNVPARERREGGGLVCHVGRHAR